jgi:hypothetical protein
MFDTSASQKLSLAAYKKRLALAERGEIWIGGHPGPFTAQEKADEIAHLKAVIAEMEAGDAP